MARGEAPHPARCFLSHLAWLLLLSRPAEDQEGGGGPERRREGQQEGGGGKPSAEPAGVTLGQCPPVPSSSFKIPVVSFVQHKKNHSNQQLEKWVEEAKGKKDVESEHIGIQGISRPWMPGYFS